MTRITTPLAALAFALTLAACNKNENAEPTPTEEPSPVVEPSPEPSNDTAMLPPPEEPAPDAQMMDDASATGMTARSDREQRQDDAETDTAPAETARRRE